MQVQGSAPPAGELLREIDDPHNGDRWLLMRDDKHPGGPGLMVLAATARMGPGDPGNPSSSIQVGPEVSTPAPIIRVGDRVIVEENTAIVEARLEAVAMGPALAGVPFNVRLSIGGRVVRAVATTPGRAVFEERTEGLR
jgi:predicted secreted protein